MSALNSTYLASIAGEDNQLVAGSVGAAAILVATAVYYALRSKDEAHEFPKLRGIQFLHAWNFFRQRYDFVQSNLRRNLGKSFYFNILHHKVIVLTGEDARRAFYSSPHLNLDQGYKILVGIPRVSDSGAVSEESEEVNVDLFSKWLNKMLNRARIQDVLPTLLQGIAEKADKWGNDGKNGRIDPFTEIYDFGFIMTARMTTCHDLTKNEGDLKRIGELLATIQTSSTPASLLLPWFPGPARMSKKQATAEMYTILYTYVEIRRRAEPTSDTIDILISSGETTEKIIEFLMVVLFASIVNISIVSCWTLINLAIHPEWKEKCKKEIQALLSRHVDNSLFTTVHEKLAAVPVSGWDDELPILDACTRESQRIIIDGITLRRNVQKEMKIGTQVVKRGNFLVYPMADVHLNPEYYPEPYKFDPGRWLRPDPVPDAAYTFLGWGAGRHPCAGVKMARLEMKLILALFLARYEYDLVDEDGKFPDPLPVPDRNDTRQARPLGATYYFDFEKVAD